MSTIFTKTVQILIKMALHEINEEECIEWETTWVRQADGSHAQQRMELGRGGYGTVFQAKYAEYRGGRQTPVAIKVMPSTPDVEHELHVQSSLVHPHICRLYGCIRMADADGNPCMGLVMELLTGGSLYDKLRDRAGSPPGMGQRLVWLQQIASALQYLHDKGFAHGDLKSCNVVMAGDNEARLVDFGLVRAFAVGGGAILPAVAVGGSRGSGGAVDTTLHFFGTPQYAAPELFPLDGKPAQCRTPASDVYAFGVLAWEIFSRRLPYFDHLGSMMPTETKSSHWTAKVLAHAGAAVVHRGLRPGIDSVEKAYTPKSLPELIQQCWDKEPSKRPSMAVIRAALEGASREGSLDFIRTVAPPAPPAGYGAGASTSYGGGYDPMPSLPSAGPPFVNAPGLHLYSGNPEMYSLVKAARAQNKAREEREQAALRRALGWY